MNPETNSDSPSAKSNGARLHSAKQDSNQIVIIGNNTQTVTILYINSIDMLNLDIAIIIEKIKIDILISYLIDCEQERTDPIILNFLLEAQPIIKIVYTDSPIKTINIIKVKHILTV